MPTETTRRALRALIPAGVLIAGSLVAPPAFAAGRGATGCQKPPPARLLGREQGGLEAEQPGLRFQQGGRSLQWTAVRWSAPPDGEVFVLDCAGQVQARLALGAVDRLRPGPMVLGEPTVEVIGDAAWGSGIGGRKVMLLQFHGGRIITLWSHAAFDAWSQPGFGAGVKRARWTYAGSQIRVANSETKGVVTSLSEGRAKGHTRALPSETYCLQSQERRFVPCAGKR